MATKTKKCIGEWIEGDSVSPRYIESWTIHVRGRAPVTFTGDDLPDRILLNTGPSSQTQPKCLTFLYDGPLRHKKKPEPASLGLVVPVLFGLGVFVGMAFQAVAANI